GRGGRVRRRVRHGQPRAVAAGRPARLRGAHGGAVRPGIRGIPVGARVDRGGGVVAEGAVGGGAGTVGAAAVRVPGGAGAGGGGAAVAASAGGADDRFRPVG